MPQLVKTETGSQYLIDRKAGTWKRMTFSGKSGELRTEEGTFTEIQLAVGRNMALIGPPFHEKTEGRLIYTSRVVEIEEVLSA